MPWRSRASSARAVLSRAFSTPLRDVHGEDQRGVAERRGHRGLPRHEPARRGVDHRQGGGQRGGAEGDPRRLGHGDGGDDQRHRRPDRPPQRSQELAEGVDGRGAGTRRARAARPGCGRAASRAARAATTPTASSSEGDEAQPRRRAGGEGPEGGEDGEDAGEGEEDLPDAPADTKVEDRPGLGRGQEPGSALRPSTSAYATRSSSVSPSLSRWL